MAFSSMMATGCEENAIFFKLPTLCFVQLVNYWKGRGKNVEVTNHLTDKTAICRQ